MSLQDKLAVIQLPNAAALLKKQQRKNALQTSLIDRNSETRIYHQLSLFSSDEITAYLLFSVSPTTKFVVFGGNIKDNS